MSPRLFRSRRCLVAVAALVAALAGTAPAAPSPEPRVAPAAIVVTDPLFGRQWGPRVVRATDGWALRTTASPIVAVIDSGVDPSADLRGALLPMKSFVPDGLTGDPQGHGTSVAGVIAARGNNGVGVAGYCWTCRIMPIRVLDAKGAGDAGRVASGVRWAVDNGASVINLSVVMLGRSDSLESAIAYARSKGVVVVAAAGNTGGTTPTYPAALSAAIGVVATDPADAVYSWADRGTWADVAAPGCAMTTLRGGGFGEACGSSIAAPAVAGMIGLARAVFPTATVADIEAAIAASSKRLGTAVRYGRVDSAALLWAVGARVSARA